MDTQNDQYIISPVYNYITSFSESIAAIQLDDKWGFINIEGESISHWYDDYISPFMYGTACIKRDSKYYLLDLKGNEAVINNPPKFKALKKGDPCNCESNGCEICQQLGYIPINFNFDN